MKKTAAVESILERTAEAGSRVGRVVETMLRRDILVYSPEYHSYRSILAEWASVWDGPNSCVLLTETAEDASRLGLAGTGAYCCSYGGFVEIDWPIQSIAFVRVTDSSLLESFMAQNRLRMLKIQFRTALTGSPILFREYYLSGNVRSFDPYVPPHSTRSFFRSFFRGANIVYVPAFGEFPADSVAWAGQPVGLPSGTTDAAVASILGCAVSDLSSAPDGCSAGTRSLIRDPLLRKSGKLYCLWDLLRQKSQERVWIVVLDPREARVLTAIVKTWCGQGGAVDATVDDAGGDLMPGLVTEMCGAEQAGSREEAGSRFVVTENIVVTTEVPVRGQLAATDNIVLYSHLMETFDCKVYLMAMYRERGEFRDKILADDRIETEMATTREGQEEPESKRLRTDGSGGANEKATRKMAEGMAEETGEAAEISDVIAATETKEATANESGSGSEDSDAGRTDKAADVIEELENLQSQSQHQAGARKPDRAPPSDADERRATGNLHTFRVYSRDQRALQLLMERRNLVRRILCGPGVIYATARCTMGKIQTAINVHNQCGAPVEIPRTGYASPAHSLQLRLSLVEFGTLLSLDEFSQKAFFALGFLTADSRRLVLYAFYAKVNLRVEVDPSEIEGHVVMSVAVLRRGPRQQCLPTCDLVIPLRSHPRMFTARANMAIHRELKGDSSVAEKVAFLEAQEWQRASLHQLPQFEENFDVRVHIPLLGAGAESAPGACPGPSGAEAINRVFSDDSLLASLVNHFYQYGCSVVYRDFRHVPLGLPLSKILEFFSDEDFSAVFALHSLFSRKGRFLINKIAEKDLPRIKAVGCGKFARAADALLKARFGEFALDSALRRAESLQSGEEGENGPREEPRVAILTPFGLLFKYEHSSDTNRVLRSFDADKFLRFSIRDSDGAAFRNDGSLDQDMVYEYFRRVMLDGLTIGRRKYFFLAASASQMKSHNAWFMTPYERDGVLVGTDYIKNWLGDFSTIKNIGKYLVRLGQAFSSTTESVEPENPVTVDDLERNGYCFTDGVGLISKRLAVAISSKLGMTDAPTAFQIRFAGCKGVVAVHPLLDDPVKFLEWAALNNYRPVCGCSAGIALADRGQTNESGLACGHCRRGYSMPDLIVRESMKKFSSRHRNIEIVSTARSCKFFLNRQIILILEGLQVPPEVFTRLQDQYVLNILREIETDLPGFVRKSVPFFPRNFISAGFRFFRRLLRPVLEQVLGDLNKKAKIHIPEGRAALGVLDELGILEADEIFLKFAVSGGSQPDECCAGVRQYGGYAVPVGQAIIVKNPCMHPGDIRVVRCVDRMDLHYLTEVVVFSQRGDRPLFNQCSGSDLDGDIFFVSWNPLLIPKVLFKPYNYRTSVALSKETVLLKDMINLYVRYMKNYQLGLISRSFLSEADQSTVFGSRSLQLAELFNRNIDFLKTGNIASIPEDLIPDSFPDFMEKLPSYKSERVAGILYRRSTVGRFVVACECAACMGEAVRTMSPWQRSILGGTAVRSRKESFQGAAGTGSGPGSGEDPDDLFRAYKDEIAGLMRRAGVRTEAELFVSREYSADVQAVLDRFSRALPRTDLRRIAFLSSRCGETINSLIWLSADACKMRALETVRPATEAVNRRTEEGFVFNRAIVLLPEEFEGAVPHEEFVLDETNYSRFYECSAVLQRIPVRADLKKYSGLLSRLDPERIEIFGEIFNLLLICRLFNINQIDDVIDLFLDINSSLRNSSRLEFTRVLFSLLNDSLFKIGLLLPFDCPVPHKYRTIMEERAEMGAVERPPRILKNFQLIIHGMLDENEDIEFSSEFNVLAGRSMHVPVLMNKGTCSLDYYRDNVREFLINMLYSRENISFIKNTLRQGDADALYTCQDFFTDSKALDSFGCSSAEYRVIWTPGDFFLSTVDAKLAHDRMSVKELEYRLSSKNQEIICWYANNHIVLDSAKRPEFLKKIKPMKKRDSAATLTLLYKGTRYDLEYSNSVLCKILRGRNMMGKVFILNRTSGSHDQSIQMVRAEAVYDSVRRTSSLTADEAFLLRGNLYSVAGGKCVLSKVLGDCTFLRLEMDTPFSNDESFFITHRTVYTGAEPGAAAEAEGGLRCYVEKAWQPGECFNKMFGKLWRAYTGTLAMNE